MTTWHDMIRSLARSLWETRRGQSLSFGDQLISKKHARDLRSVIEAITPSLILDDELDLGEGNPYPDDDFHLIVGDTQVTGAWIRGYVWSKWSTMREDPDGEIGVEINLNIQHVHPENGQVFVEQYHISCWGDDEKPRISAGVYVQHFGETGYEGNALGTKVISEANAKALLTAIRLTLRVDN